MLFFCNTEIWLPYSHVNRQTILIKVFSKSLSDNSLYSKTIIYTNLAWLNIIKSANPPTQTNLSSNVFIYSFLPCWYHKFNLIRITPFSSWWVGPGVRSREWQQLFDLSVVLVGLLLIILYCITFSIGFGFLVLYWTGLLVLTVWSIFLFSI